MAGKKHNRAQVRAKQVAQARRAAEQAQRNRIRKRRASIGALVALLAAVGVLAAFLSLGDEETTDVATTPSSTAVSPSTKATPSTRRAVASAAGKPCVPMADPLPPGAPAVPVKAGPPPTALVAEDLKPGTGAVVTPDQTLTVHYIGVSCSTGTIFDSSYTRGKPASFPLSGVIPGWQQGIPGMKVGGQRLLGIPSEQAYGKTGQGDIAPDEALWFVVEVLEAKAA